MNIKWKITKHLHTQSHSDQMDQLQQEPILTQHFYQLYGEAKLSYWTHNTYIKRLAACQKYSSMDTKQTTTDHTTNVQHHGPFDIFLSEPTMVNHKNWTGQILSNTGGI